MRFMDLPDHCLLLILDYCETNTVATLTTVSTKLKQLTRNHILHKNTSYNLAAVNAQDIAQCLVAVARLIRALNPSNFHVKIYRNLQASKEMPLISVDTDTSSTELFVEAHFLESLHCLNNIGDRIEAISIYNSIYDSHNNDPVHFMNFAAWSNLKRLCFTGHDKRLCHFLQFPRDIWDLDSMSFGSMHITADFFNDAVQTGRNLKNITFQNCAFDNLLPEDIISVAETVRDRGGHFPLGLTFANVDIDNDGLLEVMLFDVVRTYVYIQLESMFMAYNLP